METLGPRLPSFVTPTLLAALFAGTAGCGFLRWIAIGSNGWPAGSYVAPVSALALGALVFGAASRRSGGLAAGLGRAVAAGAIYAVLVSVVAWLEALATSPSAFHGESVFALAIISVYAAACGALLSFGLAPFVVAATLAHARPNLNPVERVALLGGAWSCALGGLGIGMACAAHMGRTHQLDLQAHREMAASAPSIAAGLVAIAATSFVRARRRAWLASVARGDVATLRLDPPGDAPLPALDDTRRGRTADLVAVLAPPTGYRTHAAARHALARVVI